MRTIMVQDVLEDGCFGAFMLRALCCRHIMMGFMRWHANCFVDSNINEDVLGES
jgi:hypothetical protein